ncbi:MAG: purine-nucleoside phosphorylase [Candidatus Zixiibacteriota bacterium]
MLDIRIKLEDSVGHIKKLWDGEPYAGIILGTGMGKLVDKIDIDIKIPYEEIPHFAKSTVESHKGEMILGELEGVPIVAMSGRFHYYEGYSMPTITYPVRLIKALGAEVLLVSNACGGLNPLFEAGDIMLITDHINFMGDSPLRGINDPELGVRFPDMSKAYTPRLQQLARDVALETGQPLEKGVYLGLMGPNLETPAEYRFLRKIGADAVGMSTVPEVIVAVHSSLEVMGFSIVTDMCLPDNLEVATLEKILGIANQADEKLSNLISEIFMNPKFKKE